MSISNLNPGWLSFGAIVFSGVMAAGISQALNSHEAKENREFRAEQRSWNAKTESQIANDKLDTREALVALKLGMDSALKGVASIQQALMVPPPRPTSQLVSSTP